MPKRHTGVKHPRDPAQLAKLIVYIATGEVDVIENGRQRTGRRPSRIGYGPQGRKGPRCEHKRRGALANSQKRRTFTLGCHERGRDLTLEASEA